MSKIREFVTRWNDGVPAEHRASVWYETDVSSHAVTILECRPPWHPDDERDVMRSELARLRYWKRHDAWSLYYVDGNGKFWRYGPLEESEDVEELLEEIDQDPTAVFFG